MAMVSHEREAIFLHAPKNGGTTIRLALASAGWKPTWQDPLWMSESWQHHFDIPPAFEHYKVFTVWRQPFDRYVSLWCYKTQIQYHHKNVIKRHDPSTTLEEFDPGEVKNCLGRYQYPYIQRADVVIDFESLEPATPPKELAGYGIKKWSVANNSSHAPWYHYMTDEIAAKIVSYYDHDFYYCSKDWREHVGRKQEVFGGDDGVRPAAVDVDEHSGQAGVQRLD